MHTTPSKAHALDLHRRRAKLLSMQVKLVAITRARLTPERRAQMLRLADELATLGL